MRVRDGLPLLEAHLPEQVHSAPITRAVHTMLWFSGQLALQDVPHLLAKRQVLAFAVQCAGCRAEDLRDGFMQQRMLGRGDQNPLVGVVPCGADARNHVASRSCPQDVTEPDEERGLDVEVTSSTEE